MEAGRLKFRSCPQLRREFELDWGLCLNQKRSGRPFDTAPLRLHSPLLVAKNIIWKEKPQEEHVSNSTGVIAAAFLHPAFYILANVNFINLDHFTHRIYLLRYSPFCF